LEKIDNLIKGKGLHIALIMLTFFVIYRMFVIGSIHSERELPIEVDDAYVYISQAHMFYDNYDRTKETTSSVISIAKLTLENDTSDNVQNVSRYYGWAAHQAYYLYSATFGFFTEILNINPVKVWWSFAYITQILVALSVALMINLYMGTNRIPLIIASILCAFISIEVVHQITATPLTIANSILLIGWYFLNKSIKSKVLWLVGGTLIALALHVHPGAFVIFGLLSFSSLVFWYLGFEHKEHYRNIFFFSVSMVLFIVMIESLLVYVFNGDRYLSVVGYKALASVRHDMTLIELLSYNFYETKERLKDFTDLNSFKNLGIYIFLFSLYVTYKLNTKVFIINLVFLLGNIVGLLHYLPYHRGELIEYIGQSQLIFIAMAFSYLYFRIIQFVKNNNKRNMLNIVILIIFSTFIINKYQSTVSQIESRSSRHNFENDTLKIKEFIESLPKDTSVIIGDEFVYIMMLSEISNRHIMLADHMRKGGKSWSIPGDFPPPSGYIGKPLKSVLVAGKKYELVSHSHSNRIIFSKIEL
jgi:hypothetical protein